MQSLFWRPFRVRRIALSAMSVTIGLLFSGGMSAMAEGEKSTADRGKVEFNRDVRPILADRCFRCRGPDANHREADLRLDTPEGAAREIDGHRAIVPGDPSRSELITRITSSDPDAKMPPADSGKTLSAAEIALLRRWIEQGGEIQPH